MQFSSFTSAIPAAAAHAAAADRSDPLNALLTPDLRRRLDAGEKAAWLDVARRLREKKYNPPPDDPEDGYGLGLAEPTACAAPPCTDAKMEALCDRAGRKQSLFSARDHGLPDRLSLIIHTVGNAPVVCGVAERSHRGLAADDAGPPRPKRPRSARSLYQQALSLDPVARAAEANRKRRQRLKQGVTA